jgi:transcriptional regulator with XRE-family HTH domain
VTGEKQRELNLRAAEALVRVRRKLVGDRAVAFAERLREHLGADGPHRTTYAAWEKGERDIPAYALLAAAELAETTVSELLDETAEIDQLKAELRTLAQRVEALEKEKQEPS